ncbi:hypothetical protein Ciccas_000053 [Cichlidogyrus casuarinus]|uniref:Uncharacterized protein n=1 Tax=Cichlidogyrus casuarinus TaxID=1844966 RepID=A0ABD2QP12_9PLAT
MVLAIINKYIPQPQKSNTKLGILSNRIFRDNILSMVLDKSRLKLFQTTNWLQIKCDLLNRLKNSILDFAQFLPKTLFESIQKVPLLHLAVRSSVNPILIKLYEELAELLAIDSQPEEQFLIKAIEKCLINKPKS